MGNIIGDLRVLSHKCNRDIGSKFHFNYEYYLREFNRILEQVKQIQPDKCVDIGYVKEAQSKSAIRGSLTHWEVAKHREVSAEIDKLLSRLIGQNTKEKLQPSWRDIEGEFGITKMSFGRKINFITIPFKRTIIFRDVEQAFILASLGFSKPAVILAGGVIEELLRLYLEHKNITPISNSFDGYIQTCEQKGLLEAGISRLSDSARHFRNLVHLSKEESKRHTISKSTAKGAVASIFTIANDF